MSAHARFREQLKRATDDTAERCVANVANSLNWKQEQYVVPALELERAVYDLKLQSTPTNFS